MSSDLVKRLMTYGDGSPGGILLMREAAARIEALEGERDRFLAGGLEADNRTLRATRRAEAAESERDRLQLANARMKAALEAISEGDKPTTYMHLGTALAIARKALGDAS